jgi:hypothetical protein
MSCGDMSQRGTGWGFVKILNLNIFDENKGKEG